VGQVLGLRVPGRLGGPAPMAIAGQQVELVRVAMPICQGSKL
jgi:hypothetical protein